jgi:ubiquinone/menaquinone biosynthesis C-methylase UbiE
MRRLAGGHELLDGPLDAHELQGNLHDLARVNRWLGGAGLTWRALEPLVRGAAPGRLRFLDVGTGAADTPLAVVRRAAAAGIRVDVVASDIRAEIVDFARRQAAATAAIQIEQAEPDHLAAADASFDVVHASLVLHHLEPPDAAALLGEMARVAARAVIINDLDRARLWWAGAWLLTRTMTGNRYTRHDAPLSVRRAYRPDEVRLMAERAGLRESARHWSLPRYRYALVFVPRGDAIG